MKLACLPGSSTPVASTPGEADLGIPDSSNIPMRQRFRRSGFRRRCLFFLGTLVAIVAHAAETARTFPTPEAAVDALVEACRNADRAGFRQVFGLDADGVIAADQVQATNELANFHTAYQQRNLLVRETEDRVILEVGTDRWPFPIPIVRGPAGWSFDTAAGREELLNRHIGRNELAALETIRAYVDAQREYASRDRDEDGVLEFARHLASPPGTRDGLYWPPDDDTDVSPLGPLVAQARSEGYRRRAAAGEREPFHGYYFKILERQGRHAPGGRHGYVINGNMIAGFALVAWPAQYGESGIMTFIVNQQGRILQKDLGSRTSRLAASMTTYDPDATWIPCTD